MLLEKAFNTGKIAINYIEGPNVGSPFLMLHGLTGSWQGWEPFLPPFTSTWHVYACDLRGHGKSGRVAGQYHFVDYAQDVVAVLHGLIGAPTVIMGHSLGAMTTIAIAAQAPELVRAIVLLDPPISVRHENVGTGIINWFTWVRDMVNASLSYEQIEDECRKVNPNDNDAAIKELADRIYNLDVGTVNVAIQHESLIGWDMKEALQNITCPTLLLRGERARGAAMSDDDAAYVQANLPQVVNVKIPDGTHMFMWEKTDTTMPYIQSFLQCI